MALNTAHISVALAAGTGVEFPICESVKGEMLFDGKPVLSYRKATRQEDLGGKIDAVFKTVDREVTVQIKMRDRTNPKVGQDIGIAMIRGINGTRESDFDLPSRSDLSKMRGDGVDMSSLYDRDLKKPVDMWLCLDPSGTSICCALTEDVRKICWDVLDEYCESDQEITQYSRVFKSKLYPGTELRSHYDRRDSYWKFICYVTKAAIKGRSQILPLFELA